MVKVLQRKFRNVNEIVNNLVFFLRLYLKRISDHTVQLKSSLLMRFGNRKLSQVLPDCHSWLGHRLLWLFSYSILLPLSEN